MWNDTRILDLLGIEHPILQAPMAGATTAELAVAVSEAGGLGSFGGAATSPDALRAMARTIRQRTDRPYNMNLFVPDWEPLSVDPAAEARMQSILEPYHAELDAGPVPPGGALFGPFEDQLAALVEERVPVVSFHFGAPVEAVRTAKASGAKVLSSATTVAEAEALVEAGVDAVIAQGAEAGGHRGTFAEDWQHALIGTLALVPQIVDAVDVPVIAAGGIMDGRGVAASLALGASAAQLGTAFLACPENSIAPAYREAVLDSAADRPAVTRVFSGKPARGLRNRYLEEMSEHEAALLPFPAQYAIFGKLRARATELGEGEFLPMWAGQGVGLARELPAGELVQRLVDEAALAARRLPG